jgi:hypothetical protein
MFTMFIQDRDILVMRLVFVNNKRYSYIVIPEVTRKNREWNTTDVLLYPVSGKSVNDTGLNTCSVSGWNSGEAWFYNSITPCQSVSPGVRNCNTGDNKS